jgi:hypothetical protein
MEFIEDDGRTRDYLDGIFSSLPIQASQDGTKVEIKVGPVFGKYPGELVKRKFTFVMHDLPEPKNVEINGIQSSAGFHNLEQRQLVVPIDSQSHSPITINIEL